MQPGQRPTSSASRSAAPSEDTVARAPGSTAAPRPEPAAPDPATTQVPPAPVSMDGPAPSRPGTRPTGLSARLGRRLRWGGLARRRDTTWLPAEPADDPTAPPPAEDTPVVTVRAPVATGFLLATGVMLALSVVWVLQTNGQLLVWIAAALFIALGLDPVVRRIERWGAPRWAGVIAAALGLAAVAGAIVALLVPTVVEQSTQLVTGLPATVADVMGTPWFQQLDRQFQIRDAVNQQVEGITSDGAALFGDLVALGQTLLNGAFSVLIVVVLSLYFLASLPHVKSWVYRMAPRSKRGRVEVLGEEISSSVGYYVMGQTVVAVLNGTVAFLAMSIAGTPFAVLLAFAAAILAFIPLVGAVIGGTLLTLMSLLESWQTAALFAAIYFLYLQVEAYVVSPRVMARAVAVPASVAVIAVIAGGALLGPLGAIMGIPTAAAILLLVREVFIPRQDER